MSKFSKLSEQKRVNDRSEKNDTRNKVERLPLNPVRELCENRRNLYVLVAIDRQPNGRRLPDHKDLSTRVSHSDITRA